MVAAAEVNVLDRVFANARQRGGPATGARASIATVMPATAQEVKVKGGPAVDEDEKRRRTAGGRDSDGQPYPIQADVYAKIRAEPARPLLAMALWNVETANDASLLAIAHAIASVFIEGCAR